jgi:hypothetical protein
MNNHQPRLPLRMREARDYGPTDPMFSDQEAQGRVGLKKKERLWLCELVEAGMSGVGGCQYSGSFRFGPSFHRRRANVTHTAQAQKNRHHNVIAWNLHEHHEIVLPKSIKQLHLPTRLLDHATSRPDPFGSVSHIPNALFSPVSKNHKTRQDSSPAKYSLKNLE